jgi:predicted RNase H-like HicB family nuclease
MKRTYLVVFGKCKGSNFSGHAPDILGCVSVGDTLEEMTAMMREALEFHFEGMLEDDESIPEPSATSISFDPGDFDDVEYFVIQQLEVNVPTRESVSEPSQAHQAA